MSVNKYIFKSRAEWLEGRKGHIGGSDASACVGMNPYKDNVQLWEEKRGLVIPEDISDRDYVRYGTEAEKHLRALFAMDYPQYQVTYDEDNMFINTAYPWIHPLTYNRALGQVSDLADVTFRFMDANCEK